MKQTREPPIPPRLPGPSFLSTRKSRSSRSCRAAGKSSALSSFSSSSDACGSSSTAFLSTAGTLPAGTLGQEAARGSGQSDSKASKSRDESDEATSRWECLPAALFQQVLGTVEGFVKDQARSTGQDVSCMRLVCRDWLRLTDVCLTRISPRDMHWPASDTHHDHPSENWNLRFPRLQHLIVTRHPEALANPAFLEDASNLAHLKSIVIHGFAVIADDHLRLAVAALPNLNCLLLSYCYKVSDCCFQDAMQALPNLTTLELSFCRGLRDGTLRAIRLSLPKLRSLCLRSSINVTDIGMLELSQITSLTSLDITFCYRLTDAGLACLQRLANLCSLVINDCTNFTDDGIASLHKLKNLRSLKVAGCHGLTHAGRIAVMYVPKGLAQLHHSRQRLRDTPYRVRSIMARVQNRHMMLEQIRSFRWEDH